MSSSYGKGSVPLKRGVSAILLFILGVILVSCTGFIPVTGTQPTITPTPPDSGNVTVTITNPGLRNVVVRVLDNPWVDTLADDEKLILQSCGDGQFVTAWSPGYYIAIQPCSNGKTNYEFTLEAYYVNDNAWYSWVEARYTGQRSCEACHSNAENGMGEYLEWKRDGHSTVFEQTNFWAVYLGADVSGNRSPDTQWGISENSKHVRLMPDRSRPYYGPGFKSDYPADNGNCAYCHAPASVTGSQGEVDLTTIINSARFGQHSVAAEGVTCDVCHKVLNVRLAQDGRPYPDRPGVLSYDFVREDQNANNMYVVGSLPGVNPGETNIKVTCSPVFSQSQFCAPCHSAKFWDTQIYNSYGEWLDSPYANPADEGSYKTCQACHMVVNNGTPEGDTQVKTSSREACSESNVAHNDFSHNTMQRGADNVPLLIKDAAKINLESNKVDGKIELKVRVTNTKAGHKFPTDSPLRHLILVIEARDKAGTLLPQVDGPTIPAWGGVGNQSTDYAGRPGEIYANILMDMDTNQAPTIAYWNPTRAAWKGSDTRLEPHKPRASEYVFAMPSNGYAIFTVRLIYRYAFVDIARQKGWSINDIVVTEETVEVH